MAYHSDVRLATGTRSGVILWDISQNPAKIVDRVECGTISAVVGIVDDGPEPALLAGRDDGTILRLGRGNERPFATLGSRKFASGISSLTLHPGRREFYVIEADATCWKMRTDLIGQPSRQQAVRSVVFDPVAKLVARLIDGPRVEIVRQSDAEITGHFFATRPANSLALLGSSSSLVVGGAGFLWFAPLEKTGEIRPGQVREMSGYSGAVVVAAEPMGTRLAIGDGSGRLEIVDERNVALRGVPISLDDIAELAFFPESRLYRTRTHRNPSSQGRELNEIRHRIERGDRFGQLEAIRKSLAKDDRGPQDRAEFLALEATLLSRTDGGRGSELSRILLSARDLFASVEILDRQADMEFWLGCLKTPHFDKPSEILDRQSLIEAIGSFRRAAKLYRNAVPALERQSVLCDAARSWVELNLGNIHSATQTFGPVADAARGDPVLNRVVELEVLNAALATAKSDYARAAAANAKILERLAPDERPELRRQTMLNLAAVLVALESWESAAALLSEERADDPEWTIRRAVCLQRAGRAVKTLPKPAENDPVAAHLRAVLANHRVGMSSEKHIADLPLAAEGHRSAGREDLADEADLLRAECLERMNRKAESASLYRGLRTRIALIAGEPSRRTPRPILHAGPRIVRGLARMEMELGRPVQALGVLEDGVSPDREDICIGRSAGEFATAESLRDSRVKLESLGGYGTGPESESLAIEIGRLHTALAGHSRSSRSDKPVESDSFGLSEGEAMLVVSRIGAESLLLMFVDSQGKIETARMSIRVDELGIEVARWRQSLGNGGRPVVESSESSPIGLIGLGPEPDGSPSSKNRTQAVRTWEERLHDALIAPFAGRLQNIQTLFVVADDALSAMPLEVIGKVGRLGDRVSVRLLDRSSSLALLRDISKAERPTDRRAVLFSADDPSSSTSRLSALAKGWKTKTITTSNATPDHLLGDSLSSVDILHIIAPLRADATLQLHAGEWPGRRDGIVEASDLARIPLRATILVLEIADAKSTSPRALREVARAGLETGAESVILTLWKHPEESSARFFDSFYQAIAIGKSSAEAITMARSAVARDPKFRDPVHWAGYAYYGR